MVVTSKSYIFVITVRSYNMPERTGCFKSAFGTFPVLGKPYKWLFNILVYS